MLAEQTVSKNGQFKKLRLTFCTFVGIVRNADVWVQNIKVPFGELVFKQRCRKHEDNAQLGLAKLSFSITNIICSISHKIQ